MSSEERWVAIAIVARPHALRGGLILKPLTRTPDELVDAPVEQIYLRRRDQITGPFAIISKAIHKGLPFIYLEGVEVRTDAERLVGSEVVIREDDRWELEEGRFYFDQLEGLPVFGASDGEEFGKVLRVQEGAAHDYLVLAHPRKPGQEILLPLIPQFVSKVDLEAGRILAIFPEGLLDI